MSRVRLRTHAPDGGDGLATRLAGIAEAVGLELIEKPSADAPASLVVRAVGGPRAPVGLDDIAMVQARASEAGNALLVVVVPVATDAYIRAALRRAGAFEVLRDGPDFEDDFTGLVHVARRVTRLELERERLVGELAHHDRLSTVGLLAAGVGHEINNPCGAILANTEMVRDAIEQVLAQPRFRQGEVFHRRAGDWLDALGDTLGATRRIGSIVRSLNVFSRRTSDGSAPLPTNLNTEVETVLRLVGKEVRLQAHVELDLGADVPDVLAPPFAMTQVVSNLVVNALQSLEASHADPTNRRLHILTAADEDSVLLEVTDNGSGIPPDVLGRVFDPFFTTKPVGSGTGLGLSITRELVHRCGGEVFVESERDRGATFRVILPIERTLPRRVRPMSEAPPPMLRHRVLLVDDDYALLRAMTRSLQEHLECVAETSGEAAIARIRAGEHFDAVLLDVVMPGIDGVDTWKAIGAISPEIARRTVFMSGGVRVEERRSALHDSGQPLLPKPTELSAILAALRAMARPKTTPPAPPTPSTPPGAPIDDDVDTDDHRLH